MKAGHLVANWIANSLRIRGYNQTVRILASSIGFGLARFFVSRVAQVGATAAIGSIAVYFGVGSSLAGPLGWIIGFASGWL